MALLKKEYSADNEIGSVKRGYSSKKVQTRIQETNYFENTQNFTEKIALTAIQNTNAVAVNTSRIIGTANNDVLYGTTGADIMEGGSGNDTYYVNNIGDKIIETTNNPTQRVSLAAAPPNASWITSEYLKDIYTRTYPRIMGNQWHTASDGLFMSATKYIYENGVKKVDWNATRQENAKLVNIIANYFDYVNLNRAGRRDGAGSSEYSDLFLDNYDSIYNPNKGLLKTRNDIYAAMQQLNRKVYIVPYLNMTDVFTYQSVTRFPEWNFWHSQKLFNGQNFGTWDYANKNKLFIVVNGEIIHYGTDSTRPMFDSRNPLWQQYYAAHVKGILDAGFDGIMSDNWMRTRWTGDTYKIPYDQFVKIQQGWNYIGNLIQQTIGPNKFLIGNSPADPIFTTRDICFLEDRVDDRTGTSDKSIASYFRYTDLARSLNQVVQDTYWDENCGPFENFRLPINLLTDNILGLGNVTNTGRPITSFINPIKTLGDIGVPLGNRLILPGTATGIRDTIKGYSVERAVYVRYYSEGVVFLNGSDARKTVTLPQGKWLRSDGSVFTGGSRITLDPYRGWVFKNTETPAVTNTNIDKVVSSISYTLGPNIENLELTGTNNLYGIGNELNNVITGNSGNNILEGREGNDTLNGGSGNDTYQFLKGDGQDKITDTAGSDRIKFGNGISQNDLSFSRVESNTLQIKIASTNDQINIIDWFASDNFKVERIDFNDGRYLTSSQINQLVQQIASYNAASEAQISKIPDSSQYQNLMDLAFNN